MTRHLRPVSAVGLGLGLFGVLAGPAACQGYGTYPLEARIWLDAGSEPILRRGEQVRIYYRVSESAYVAVFHIDTNGTARLLFPGSPQENHFARGGRDYRLLVRGASSWFVNEDPGVGYFFLVASPEPFDFSRFGYSRFSGGWDLTLVGRQVYRDPYLAMDDYVAALIPDWEVVGYALDFVVYRVEGPYDFPRFLCYDCHGFRPYWSWNPYAYTCTTFRLVIYTDPYYYPSARYRSTRVVYAQPWRGAPQFVFKERSAGEGSAPQKVVRGTPPTSQPGVAGAELRRPAQGGVEVSGSKTLPDRSPSGGTPVPSRRSAGLEARGTEALRPAGGGGLPGSASPNRPSDALRRDAASSAAAGAMGPVPGTRPEPAGQTPSKVRPAGRGTDPAWVQPVQPPSLGGSGGGSAARPVQPGLSTGASGTPSSAPRPVLERRPASGGSSSPPGSGGGTPPPASPPAAGSRPPGGGAAAPPSVPARRPGGGG